MESRWQKLKLASEKDNEIVVEDEHLLKEIKKEKNSIIGKLLVERSIGKDIIRNTIGKIWKTSSPSLSLILGQIPTFSCSTMKRIGLGHVQNAMVIQILSTLP